MRREVLLFALGVGIMLLTSTTPPAVCLETGLQPSFTFTPTGPHVLMDALVPTLRKWYLPQELYRAYEWKSWEYSNYAKTPYGRYVDIILEGRRYYDLYGSYIGKGWKVYDWTESQPALLGNELRKGPQYSGWFDQVLISSASKGQFYTAVTIGDALRTTLTPMTFSQPSFNGIQWDFLTDKYAFTTLLSRINNPATAVSSDLTQGTNLTNSTELYGLRGTIQLGDFMKVGGTYVNAHNMNSSMSFRENSLKGVLTEAQNSKNIEDLTIRISDDSPEDGVGGAVLYAYDIVIDGRKHSEVVPLVRGGLRIGGLLVANGNETITLSYNIRRDFTEYDYKLIQRIEFLLVLANDYKVEVTSNVQVNTAGEQIYLPVVRAEGNVKDGSNQQFVRFMYGLPTGSEIYGFTFEVMDFKGFNLFAEWDMNRRFRRYPNVNFLEHPLAVDPSDAFYLTASHVAYPWFVYGEIFTMDPTYSTSVFIPDAAGAIDYEDIANDVFEFVDDNDDQDRYPDWNRRDINQREGYDRAIFPGLDENNDLLSDFNENDNLYPDYDEPFLRYNVDPPEYLFGMDMNNNGTPDRFENDNLADYPYQKDHRGYNVYGGVEVVPGVRLVTGYMDEWLLSRKKRSESRYALLTTQQDYPRIGRIQLFNLSKRVRDDIQDDLYQWVQPRLAMGSMQTVTDPLIQRNTFVNTLYFQFDYTGIRGLNFVNKLKVDTYRQQGTEKGVRPDARFFGIVNKLDYSLKLVEWLTIMPKFKSMYQNSKKVPGTWGSGLQRERKELSEFFLLMANISLFGRTSLELGYEGTWFKNYIASDDPELGDYWGNVTAMQFSNASDYLGYRVTGKIGFRWERLDFEEFSKINTVAFVRMYASAE